MTRTTAEANSSNCIRYLKNKHLLFGKKESTWLQYSPNTDANLTMHGPAASQIR